MPPPQPAWPGGYDFARDAYYREIGAVGSVLGRDAARDPRPRTGLGAPRRARLSTTARNALTQRIAAAIGGPAGGVGAALVTGKRGLIRRADQRRAARRGDLPHRVDLGPAHGARRGHVLLARAGALRALAPALALLWPVKKIAAVLAMVGATAYCIFSGSDVATERSLVMTLVMFGAVLVDRPALTMRNLAIAAIVVLAREPEACSDRASRCRSAPSRR